MTSKIKVGYGLDEAVQMGLIRDKDKKANILQYIGSGIQDGFNITGGSHYGNKHMFWSDKFDKRVGE
jgi:acyl-CoA reductase-like NAD-dependent aldehyde dehydrogenase